MAQVLGWIGDRPVEFIKVDAQGMDLRVIESAGGRLAQIRRFGLEGISDDCHGLYVGQPNCSSVVARASELGYRPASPVRCMPLPRATKWRRTAWGCELELVFVRRGIEMLPSLWDYHSRKWAGCNQTVRSWEEVPPGTVLMEGPSLFRNVTHGATKANPPPAWNGVFRPKEMRHDEFKTKTEALALHVASAPGYPCLEM